MEVWRSPTKGVMSFEEMLEDIRNYVAESPENIFVLRVGTDAQRHGRKYLFVTSVACLKVGNGGRYWESNKWVEQKFSLGEKIWAEAYDTLLISIRLTEKILSGELPVDNLRPAVDIGTKGKTSQFIKSIEGLFKSYDFGKVDIKPYSFAASTIADRSSK